jgi:hypothetical protein
MFGYLDTLSTTDIADFKVFILEKINQKSNWLNTLNIKKKITGIALDFFLKETLSEFKANR